ncbi:AAA family ATPase [Saccharothrix sp. NRRL B-16348]|uniref:AAA family ATPase n=1 Tax=Saccharothrix sp. NRRL B-16348 TaxID=1415542 RepID=UPI0018D14751|nr:AAA family ATPase [Saccharothrix sp. NRRL B-16348]
MGKSALLRELFAGLVSEQNVFGPRDVFRSYEAQFSGTADDYINSLGGYFARRPPGQYADGYYREDTFKLPSGILPLSAIRTLWGSSDIGLGRFGQLFALYLDAANRLEMAHDAPSCNLLGGEHPNSPVQHLYASPALEERFSALMERAFDMPITVGRVSGNRITLHVGSVDTPLTFPPTEKYIASLRSLPRLQEQGDGVRAFAGMLLSIITGRYGLIIIDEPEAFLHPAQAYLLGQLLAEQHVAGTQVVVATHSADVIEGITSVTTSQEVSVVRLTRKVKSNHVAQMHPDTVRRLYQEPLIRYYPILDGLFAQGVVVCEADSDCTYYRAVLESCGAADGSLLPPGLGVHFTHCSGKARIARVMTLLGAARVPAACIVDIDILQNVREFEGLIEACGMHPAEAVGYRNSIAQELERDRVRVKRSVTKERAERIFSSSNSEFLAAGELRDLKAMLTPRSAWSEMKQDGTAKMGTEAACAFNTLDDLLRERGVFMVPCGELEGFHPDVSARSKSEWLRIVLEERRYMQSTRACELLRGVTAFVASRQ